MPKILFILFFPDTVYVVADDTYTSKEGAVAHCERMTVTMLNRDSIGPGYGHLIERHLEHLL